MENNEVTATIQIRYTGLSEAFSWVLPLPSTPTDFGTSSDVLFRALHAQTDPTFDVTIKQPENCDYYLNARCELLRSVVTTEDESSGNKSKPPVAILAEGEIGPFVYQVIGKTYYYY
jgi:hypothetical protein